MEVKIATKPPIWIFKIKIVTNTIPNSYDLEFSDFKEMLLYIKDKLSSKFVLIHIYLKNQCVNVCDKRAFIKQFADVKNKYKKGVLKVRKKSRRYL